MRGYGKRRFAYCFAALWRRPFGCFAAERPPKVWASPTDLFDKGVATPLTPKGFTLGACQRGRYYHTAPSGGQLKVKRGGRGFYCQGAGSIFLFSYCIQKNLHPKPLTKKRKQPLLAHLKLVSVHIQRRNT